MCDHPAVIKLAPAPNEASRVLRNCGLSGFLLLVSGLGLLALPSDRFLSTCGVALMTFGLVTLLPSLIARGIRLERDSREPS
jgi:hypothetical protein